MRNNLLILIDVAGGSAYDDSEVGQSTRVFIMKKIVVFFYIDALNSSFVSPSIMPFLANLATEHYHKELENVAGYSFAIQSCLLSGKYPEETNHWMPYFYSPKGSPLLFKTFNKIGKVFPLDMLPFLRYFMVRGSRKFFLRDGAQANNIPLCEIDRMALYPYYYMYELPFFSELQRLLDKTSRTKLSYIGPPKIRTQLYNCLLQYIKTSEHESEVIIAYDDTLDALGHMFGPYSPQCLHYAESLDHILSVIYQRLAGIFGRELMFFIFSDHGQCECSYQFNLLSELDKKKLKLSDDYLCFIDATLALFWPRDNVVKEKILEILGEIKIGKVIDETLQKRYHIRFNDERYGEIIFVLKPGGTFLPNFFSPFNAMKGLHGYLPEEEVQKGYLISNKNFSYPFRHIKDFRNLLLSISAFKG